MRVTSHKSVLTALEKRALRFQNSTDNKDKDLVEAATAFLDGNATAKEANQDFSSYSEEREIQRLLEEKRELLEVLGIAPGQKADGVTRLVYENLNGLMARLTGNDKLEKLKLILDDLEADVFGFNEHRVNKKHRDNKKHSLVQLFDGGESLVKGIWAHNKHEQIDKYISKRTQEGGTGMLSFGETASFTNRDNCGEDATGLARWTYFEIKGEEEHSTMVLVGYCPCPSRRPDNGSSYQQQRRYFLVEEKVDVDPRKRFLSDLKALLESWKSAGKRIVVMLDANEDVYRGDIGRCLTDENGLDLVEAVSRTCGKKLSATHFRGSKPIDAVWVSKELEVINAAAMPIGYGVGDHRMFVLDITTKSMVGFNPQPVKHPKARRLNSKIPRARHAYNRRYKKLLSKHRLTKKLAEAHRLGLNPERMKEALDKIDEISKECMINAEKRCRKLRNGKIPFSPEASIWIKRCQFYRSLLRYWAGKIKNRGNLKLGGAVPNNQKYFCSPIPIKLWDMMEYVFIKM
jgi:exonuclease III